MTNGITVGMDLGNKKHVITAIDSNGTVLQKATIANNAQEVTEFFSQYKEPCKVIIEAGTPSIWVGNHLKNMGHKVKLADPAKIKAIWGSTVKTDDRDSEMLARLANADMKLLNEVHLKDMEVQAHASVLKARDRLVMSRAQLVLFTRSQFKLIGMDVPACSTASFAKQVRLLVPKELKIVLQPILRTISHLTEEIKKYDKKISKLCKKYKETETLQQVNGVGPVTALGFCLAVGDKTRFKNNRSIGAYLGLVPKCDQSGDTNKQLRISKAGNSNLRRLLVNCAQHILGIYGKDSDLKRFGMRLINRGKGKNNKKKAVIAVSRKLSVLLLKLYKTGEEYIPLKNSLKKAA